MRWCRVGRRGVGSSGWVSWVKGFMAGVIVCTCSQHFSQQRGARSDGWLPEPATTEHALLDPARVLLEDSAQVDQTLALQPSPRSSCTPCPSWSSGSAGGATGSVSGDAAQAGGGEACPEPIPTIPRRGLMPHMLNKEGFKTVVELGVDAGGFSEFNLMNCVTCEKYYMVDLWAPQVLPHYVDGSNLESSERSEERMQQATDRVARFGDKAVILRNSTLQAAKMFQDHSVDFVYVDARHDYMSVMEDLEAWWPKVRRGGMLAGHDYMDAREVKDWRGPCPLQQVLTSNSDYSIQPDGSRDNRAVKGAVDEFAQRKRRQVQVTYNDGSFAHFWFSWFIRK